MHAGILEILTHTEFTAAIKLVVEVILLYDLKATFLKTVFTPVLVPPDWRFIFAKLTASPKAGFIDLVERFPTG